MIEVAEKLVYEFMLSHYEINFVMAKSCVKTHLSLLIESEADESKKEVLSQIKDSVDNVSGCKEVRKKAWEEIGQEFHDYCNTDIMKHMVSFRKFLDWLDVNYEIPDKRIFKNEK